MDVTFQDPKFHKREMSVLSSRNATHQDFDYVIECLRDGLVDANAYMTHRSTFDAMIEPFESWTIPETGVIKTVVER